MALSPFEILLRSLSKLLCSASSPHGLTCNDTDHRCRFFHENVSVSSCRIALSCIQKKICLPLAAVNIVAIFRQFAPSERSTADFAPSFSSTATTTHGMLFILVTTHLFTDHCTGEYRVVSRFLPQDNLAPPRQPDLQWPFSGHTIACLDSLCLSPSKSALSSRIVSERSSSSRRFARRSRCFRSRKAS